jgi:glycosyltransferase involved in cell wall biosynthesis
MLFFFSALYRRIIQLNSDLVYFNYVPSSPYILPLYWRLNKRKTIVTAHDGNVKPSFTMPWISKIVFNLAFRKASYVNMFSATEEAIFKTNFNKPKTFVIPLALKNFGQSNLTKRQDSIIFFFFGSINSNKNLELLIDAACNLYEKGVRGFKIAIHGYCKNWDLYRSKIKYPDLFEYDIRVHKNSEIPDLFALNHYAVFPYKDVSQSGALKVAFNYCTPVIVSDLKAFSDEVKNGVNGFIFESDNFTELELVMRERLKMHSVEYKLLQKNIFDYNNLYYSTEILIQKYLNMFNVVLCSN